MNLNRKPLLDILEGMPEETFSYFVEWAKGRRVNYPDRLGGFQAESKDAIFKLIQAAKSYKEE